MFSFASLDVPLNVYSKNKPAQSISIFGRVLRPKAASAHPQNIWMQLDATMHVHTKPTMHMWKKLYVHTVLECKLLHPHLECLHSSSTVRLRVNCAV